MGYHQIGMILAVLSGLCLLGVIGNLLELERQRKQPTYQRKMPKGTYDTAFLNAVLPAYEAAGDIKGMLLILKGEEQWKKGIPGIRIPAALSYLETSRYRDYETALFYLSDQTGDCERLLQEILKREIRKQTGLCCKTE